MAVSAVKAGNFERAASLCESAIKHKPDMAEAFHIRGICMLRLQRPFDAVMCFDHSLNLNSEQSDCWNNRGIAMAELGLWETAQYSFQQSLQRHRSVEPHVMCGGMFAHLMHLKEAEAEFRAAIEIEPDLQDAHLKLGVVLLGQQKWEEGWREYEWRWADTPFPPRAYRRYKKWRGERLVGKTILLYAEQGFGDEIMSLRYVREIENYAQHVVLEVRPGMYRLAKASFPNSHVIAHGDDYPPGIDYSSPLLDVPMNMHLGNVEPFRAGIPYLTTSEADYWIGGRWKERLPEKGLKVGLCWVAGRRILQPETEKSAKAKTVPVQLLEPLLTVKGVTFVSLQIPKDNIPLGWPILDLTDGIDDFYDTASLINELDLVITVDTSVAHLAGALGKACWTLVRFNGYWPWLQPAPSAGRSGGEITPWYEDMRLFRQPELGFWEEPIEAIRKKLELLAS